MQVTNNPSDVGMRMHLASLMWCGLLLNEANWILYLLLIIVGLVFFTKVLARRARGQYYATIAQFYPKILRLRARIDENYEHSPFGQRWAIVWKFVRHPALYIVIGLVGMRASDDAALKPH